MARVLVLDTGTDEVRIAQCDALDDFYRELDAEPFDIARRNIGGRYYDIFVDDIGLFREDPVVSAINAQGEPMLVGNLIFTNHNEQGETISLSDEDIAGILHSVVRVYTEKRPHGYKAVMCEY